MAALTLIILALSFGKLVRNNDICVNLASTAWLYRDYTGEVSISILYQISHESGRVHIITLTLIKLCKSEISCVHEHVHNRITRESMMYNIMYVEYAHDVPVYLWNVHQFIYSFNLHIRAVQQLYVVHYYGDDM